jgi:hypothetical protein
VGKVAVLAAFVLVAGIGAAYQLGVRAHRAPSFAKGGAFLSAGDIQTPGVNGVPFPYGDATATTAAGAATTAAGSVTASPGTTVAHPAVTTAPIASTTTIDPNAALVTPNKPAVGTYTYALDGTEGATGFGSRGYPARGTDVIHADRTVRSDELVHDLRLSDQHEEREVVRYSPQGLAFSFEGGSITFGPGTQTSQATYAPLMVQVPFPLRAGAQASGSSAAKDGASTARVEDWTTKVVGQEVLTVLGQRHTTWVIDIQRTTTPGGSEHVNRFRRYWYDPALGVWVKWTERFHASRDLLVDFSYDTNYTATLVGFAPA